MPSDNTIATRYIAHALAVIRAANAMGRDVDAILVKLAGDLRYLLTRSDISELGKRDLNALLSDISDAIYQRYNDILDQQNEAIPDLIDIESTFAQKAGDYNNKPSATALAGVMSGLLILGSSLKDWWRKQATDLAYKASAAVKNAARLPESNKAAVSTILGQTRGAGQAGDLGIARRNAGSIVQTTAQAAASDARLAAFKANGVEYFEWHAILDAKVCPECAMRAGKLYTVDGEPVGHKIPYVPIPVHFHCLTGDTLVTPRGRVTAVSKREYEGKIVVLCTASGKRISCTPNHPILSDGGWIAAGALDIGNHLVGCVADAVSGIDANSENVPTAIEEIARAFSESSEMDSAEMPVAAEDFHGDGLGSDVAIVWTNRVLRDDEQPAINEFVSEFDFSLGAMGHAEHPSIGDSQSLNEWLRPSATCDVTWRGESLALLGSHFGEAQEIGFRSVANGDACIFETFIDGDPSNSIGIRKCEHGFSGKVTSNDFGAREIEPTSSHRHPGTLQGTVEDSRADAAIAQNILGGNAGPVFLDAIVDKRVVDFLGHVYNLETTENWYVANGIVSHNCRCLGLPHSGDQPSDGGPHALQFNDWLKSLTDEQENDFLGKGRAELYRRGVITLSDLINQGGQLLTLAELRAGL